jgi:MFS family permease
VFVYNASDIHQLQAFYSQHCRTLTDCDEAGIVASENPEQSLVIMNSSPRGYDRLNFAAIFADYVLFGVAMSLVGVSTVLPAFARHLTDSAPIIGSVTAVWNGAWLIPQLVAAQALVHRVYKKPTLLLSGLIGRPIFLVVTLALLLGVWRQPALMIVLLLGSLAFFWTSEAFGSIAWFDIIAKVVPSERRGRLFGLAQITEGLLALGVAVFVSFMLGPAGPPFPHNYAWLFGLASLAALLGLGALVLVREPPESAPPEAASWHIYAAQLKELLIGGTAFRRFILARLLDGLATLATPFFVVYATDVLGYGPETIGVFIAAQTIGMIISSFSLGALSERAGPGAVIRVAVMANLSGPVVALLTFPLRGASWLWIPYTWVFMVMGVSNAALMLGWMNYVLEIAPPGHRPTYTGLTNTLTGVLIPIPILGGWLLQSTSYPTLFIAAALGPLLALGLTRALARVSTPP